MLRIGTACGSGLGSSFMVQMNIESILKELGVDSVEVEHYDLGGADPSAADVWIVGRDLEDSADHLCWFPSCIRWCWYYSKFFKPIWNHV